MLSNSHIGIESVSGPAIESENSNFEYAVRKSNELSEFHTHNDAAVDTK